MAIEKHQAHGTSYGLTEAGYDIRIRERVIFTNSGSNQWLTVLDPRTTETTGASGRFILASSMEEFQMPLDLVGMVSDKSSWARQGLSVFNTVIEPGWNGILTLELVFHGNQSLTIPAGSGIAQVLFGRLERKGDYGNGKYQDAKGIEKAKF
jgi:dCTP deaminase